MFSTITTAPAKQSVSETIAVLSGRLGSATHLEDRRAAIQGLRSFAKQYPATVASGALRSLIGSLCKDGEDVDTVKVVLETLLMLFNPNENSPEASEEIALWLADEFTQRQENITLLLDLLATNDFYARLYSLKLLSAILSARTERTEECVLTAPEGIPRLVAVLEDRRDAVRNEAISLLTDLTPASVNIQKLVAFEDAFERIFKVIEEDGGIKEGTRVVEDCLILLANLVRINASNQSMFRQMGHIPRLRRLLENAYDRGQQEGPEVTDWVRTQRNRNIYAHLSIIRLFLVYGAVETPQNQEAFLRDGGLAIVLRLAFAPAADFPIKAEALQTCADMIKGNAKLQESFAALKVFSPLATLADEPNSQTTPYAEVHVIEGLLDLILAVHALQAFDLRLAACACLKAYLHNHKAVRLHFLGRAIEWHKAGVDELRNVLTTLMQPPGQAPNDPYRYWFASVIMMNLVYDDAMAKSLTMAVTEGDEANGEEVITCIQTITSNLLSSVKLENTRAATGYLMLLLCWLFEDMDGVNDFLGEASNVQRLIQAAVEDPLGEIIVQGLITMLLGVVYEFSTKDSPIPRATLRKIITSRMGRDQYIDKLARLRSHPLIRDHEVLAQKLDPSIQQLPDVFFDDCFVDFFKDNYSRIRRAIDRDPEFEISVVRNGMQKGISRELVDSLRAQLGEAEAALGSAQSESEELRTRLAQELEAHRESEAFVSTEQARITGLVNTLQAQLEENKLELQDAQNGRAKLEEQLAQGRAELERAKGELVRSQVLFQGLQSKHKEELAAVEILRQAREKVHEEQAVSLRAMAEQEAERLQRRSDAEKADLKATISRLEVDLMKANKAKSGLEARVSELEQKLLRSEESCVQAQGQIKILGGQLADMRRRLDASIQEKTTVQGELDDLLMVFTDLEEKKGRYKERLEKLGEPVSDTEDADNGQDTEEAENRNTMG